MVEHRVRIMAISILIEGAFFLVRKNVIRNRYRYQMQDMHGIIKTSYEKWGKVMYAQLKLELEADDIDYKIRSMQAFCMAIS